MTGPAARLSRAAPTAATGATVRPVRTDIQGLRAVAVSVVVIYHLVPPALPGGFVGVDVFFVLSGFLITLHLCEKVPRTGADLLNFWARRVRRLLPASLLVLAATLLLSRVVAPATQWAGTVSDVRAATLYWINWALAGDSVDYLAAVEAPSPVQHFWSLSVEEQYYLLWPVLLLGLAVLARRVRAPMHLALALGVGVTVVVSLLVSILLTRSNPAAAYFVTPTRVWELAAGSLLAVVVHGRERHRRPPAWNDCTRDLVAWGGLAAIAFACFTYSTATPFPGYAAALPVVGAVAVVAAAPTAGGTAWSPGSLLARRPMQWLGDVSYSVYLWHWPLVVLLAAAPGVRLGPARVVLVLASTLVLAAATKKWVEDPCRVPRTTRPVRAAFVAGAAGMSVVLAMTWLQTWEVGHDAEKARAELRSAVANAGPCFGAAALDDADDPDRCAPVALRDVVPPPAQAAEDRSDAYREQADGQDCWANAPSFPLRRCEFGSTDPEARTVLLLGNSHAGQWLPALQRLAEEHDLRVVTTLASQCAAVDAPQSFDQAGATRYCSRWVEDVIDTAIEERPDVVVYTNRVSVPLKGATLQQSYVDHEPAVRSVLSRLVDADLRVLVLRDTPAPDQLVPDCLATADDVAECDGTREEWLPPEPAEKATASLDDPRARFADLVDHICLGETCRAVNGGVVTYFDGSHLSATYAATLAPYLWAELTPLLREGA